MLERLETEFATLHRESQTKLFSQFRRIISAEKKRLDRGEGGMYRPILNKFDVVKVSMIGIGRVMNDYHYAVVWDAPVKSETIVVLPITSQVEPGREKFSIGGIDGLPEPDHSIDANQPQTITRKSIVDYPKKTNDGGLMAVSLSQDQQLSVLDLFHKSIMKEPSLKVVLLEKIGNKIPTNITAAVRNDLERAVNYSLHSNYLFYKLPESSEMKSISVETLPMAVSERKRIINGLVSENEISRTAAEKSISEKIARQAAGEAAAGASN